MFEHNAYYALQSADEYAWVYSETMDWWKNKIPDGLEAALNSALNKVNSNQPLGFEVGTFVDRARLEFDRKVGIGGRVTKAGAGLLSARVLSGFKDSSGNESACVVYNDLGQYNCILPYGWSGTLTPTLEGESFTPASHSYSTLTKSWTDEQNFQAAP